MNRSRFGVVILAALGVAAATLAGSALHTTSHPHATARDQAGALFANSISPFFAGPGATTQFASITVFNASAVFAQDQTVHVKKVDIRTTLGTPAWQVAPGEDCTNATIAPNGYCVIGLEFTPVADGEFEAEVELTLDDNSVFNRNVDTGRSTVEMPPTTPRQIDYGNVTVGTTTAPQSITLTPAQRRQMIMSVLPVSIPAQTNAPGDYKAATDTCTNTTLEPELPQQSCAIGVTATPAAAGNRPAFLDIAYCDPDDFPVSDSSSPGTPDQEPPPAVPPGQELICGQNDAGPILAQHSLVSLTANGVVPATPGQTFTPTLTALPAVAPAGRTTMITGTGFPDNTAVTLALVPPGTSPTTNPATVVGSVSVTTNGIGGFTNQVMLIMPHTTPGQYEVLGVAGTVSATVSFLVASGTQEPPKFVTRH